MNYKTEYKFFDDFIFRIPFFDNQQYKQLASVSDNTSFLEAVYTASSELFFLLTQPGSLNPKSLPSKLTLTAIKYLIRISTRCTPFGIFAGCGTGRIDTETRIDLTDNGFKAISSFDLSVISRLIILIHEDKQVQDHLLFYPNTTLFVFGDTFRYTEAKIVSGKRQYVLNEVSRTDYLQEILDLCAKGATRKDLIHLLLDSEYIDDEAEGISFLDELIGDKIIVSELEVGVTIKDNLSFIINKLSSARSQGISGLMTLLNRLRLELDLINNQPIGYRIAGMENLRYLLKNELSTFGINENNFIRTNLFVNPVKAVISTEIVHLVKDGLRILNMLSPSPNGAVIEKFKSLFFEKYEHEEIALCEALDPDIGVSFANFNSANIKTDPLLNGIPEIIGADHVKPGYAPHFFRDNLLRFKYDSFLINGLKEIVFDEKDFDNFTENWEDLPLTFPLGVEIYKTGSKGSPLFFLKFGGGYSAGNIIGRFSNESEEILQIAKSIAEFERKNIPDNYILAEIAYLTEDENNANLLSRQLTHEYEIPIFSSSSVNERLYRINIADLMISVNRNHELLIRSRSLNKFVIPRNSTAHNFSFQTNPLYYFLSLMQANHRTRTKLLFDWGDLNPVNGFYPRVSYKEHTILSLARWIVYPHELTGNDNFEQHVQQVFKQKGIPFIVNLCAGFDAKILLDFRESYTYEILKAELKKMPLVFEEYLFDDTDPLVTAENRIFNNEIIFNLYKS